MKHYLVFLVLLSSVTAGAHEIRGKVFGTDKKPLSGVGVYNNNSAAYTYSDDSGYFELGNSSVNDVITFYSLGYATFKLIIREAQLGSPVEIVLRESAVSLDQVVLTSKLNALNSIVAVDLNTQPVKSSQEILRKVPGLVIGQHAGGGKAEQLFLRGFDIDHGTDLAIAVDGIPVNLVSHAHGQGYSDLHFIIPETIENVNFEKGPYDINHGNFATAGNVELKTRKTIDANTIAMEVGQFNSLRGLGMIKLLDEEKSNAYMATELVLTDGVFDSPQHFNRFNIMGRYGYNPSESSSLELAIMHFQSKWDASGQIPERALAQGIIGRFGAIDDTEGGNTSRTGMWLSHRKQLGTHEFLRSTAYFTAYDFDLFSNFTFFLEDPVNGDQIRQQENRALFGGSTHYSRWFHLNDGGPHLEFEAGVGFRYDDINHVSLSHTRNRYELLSWLANGNIDELNAFGYSGASYTTGKWTLSTGLRMDYLKFDYQDLLSSEYTSLSNNRVFFSPKLKVLYTASPQWQFFLKSGLGFHSNDTRVVVAQSGEKVLPGALGTDLGVIVKPFSRMVVNAALWGLWLQQEFVYVGDAGIVEPSGKTRRLGVDLGLRYELTDWLYCNADLNYAYGRSVDAPQGQNYIPLAPDLTSSGGFAIRDLGNFSGGIQCRYVNDRPANEDGSITASGYFVTDFNLNYRWRQWSIGMIIENLFDTEWNETQFATLSRLQGETTPVEEIHFTPGTPFFLRGRISVSF
jgi:hypothetical protein